MNPVVVGGGFSGLAAACRLAGDGHPPVLFERAPQLGGRAASFHDPQLGETVDLGQHVLMGCCSAARGFLRRIGAESLLTLQPSLSIPVRTAAPRTTLRSSPLPGPLHLVPSLLRYAPLAPSQRLRVLSAAAALLAARDERLEPLTFKRWLTTHGQSADAVERLWDPICIATLNAPSRAVSARDARVVFAEAFFRRGGANLGCFNVPLSDLATSAAAYVAARGGIVKTGTAARRIQVDTDAVRGVELSDGRVVEASAVVCAAPPEALAALVDDVPSLFPIVQRAQQLTWVPIVNVHLWFDRPVMEDPFFVTVDAPIQAVFDVSQLHSEPLPHGLFHVVVSQSAAEDWMGKTDDDITSIVRDALGWLAPKTRDADLAHVRVVRQPRATFVPAPGAGAFRPSSATPVRGLTLAGDWTATGWPSTLEGAVRSGIAAAARLNLEPVAPAGSADR